MIFNQIPLTDVSGNLAEICEQVVTDRDVVIITRPEGENVALIPVDELNSLMETVHLLRSPKNADRLLTALQDVKSRTLQPQTVHDLHQELGIGEEG